MRTYEDVYGRVEEEFVVLSGGEETTRGIGSGVEKEVGVG